MSTQQPINPQWFKSSYSSGEGGECVEIATNTDAIHVRDSKERGGPQLTFSRGTWTGFITDMAWSRLR
ncbi:DUF397 domain-containing protein [Streptomyces sp. NPDC003860]